MSAKDVIKPLLSNGVQYIAEVAKCGFGGFVLSLAVLIGLVAALPSSRAAGGLATLGFVLFMLYTAAGHQRGIARVLANLTHAHGGLLFDQTLGRFVQACESRKPGSIASVLGAPGKLTSAFKGYLGNDGSSMPRPLRRLGTHYVGKVDAKLSDGALPTGAVVDGTLHQEVLKAWAVQQMREQFEPSWQLFGLLFAAQVVLASLTWGFLR
jgi:uncharacterized protein YfiM (DUF2279 family)